MSFRESNVDKGMVLPFVPLTMTFSDVHYYVDVPPVRLAAMLCSVLLHQHVLRCVCRCNVLLS